MDVRLDDSFWRTVLDVAFTPSLWTLGLPYSFCLIAILGVHEMGHYVACRIYRMDASLPFFLPGPPIIGTFGAIIRIRAPFRTRRALFDVGVAGPIAGFVVVLPVLIYGLSQSVVLRHPAGHGEIGLPSCLLLDFAYRIFFHDPGPDAVIRLHPAVAAAWFGCLATFLNLLPIGQLDGGHMLYALSRRAHRPISLAATIVLIAGGMMTGAAHLIVFGILWAAIGARHPPVLDEATGLGFGRTLVAALGLLIFVLCFIPGSLQIS
jgi:membrane-associated protease RseP (regulator of RpoE activity)